MNLPTITIQLQGMKESILNALVNYNEDIERYVEAELARQVNSFSVDSYVREEVQRQINVLLSNEISRQLRYTFDEEVASTVKAKILDSIQPREEVA